MRRWIENRSRRRSRRRRRRGRREIRKIFHFMSHSYVQFLRNWQSYFLFGWFQVEIRRQAISVEVPEAVPQSTQVIALLASQISPRPFPYTSFYLYYYLIILPFDIHAMYTIVFSMKRTSRSSVSIPVVEPPWWRYHGDLSSSVQTESCTK